MKQQKPTSIHHKRRYGAHQKRTRHFHNTYLPYLPMTVILFLSIFLSGYNPRYATLAYATEMSHQNLLAETNTERVSNNRTELRLNEQLNKAAQAKANDMIAKNYWSHNTPDGEEPWVFINAAGYSYQKAGENLAYGFSTSAATVDGWMNSPSHRDNLLDTDFQEVGFGYANGSDYNNAGEETVVVAMYGKPYVLTSTTQATPPSMSQPQENTATQQTNPQQQITPEPTAAIPTSVSNSTPASQADSASPKSKQSTNTQPPVTIATTQEISRIESLLNRTSPLLVASVTFLTGFLAAVLLLRHGVRLRKLLKNSQNFITHHPVIDSTIVALIILGITLVRTVGVIL